MPSLSILGSTGSIGRQTLSVVESLPGQFPILALAAASAKRESPLPPSTMDARAC